MNLIVDEGNTRIKLAVFNQNQLIDLQISKTDVFEKDLKRIIEEYNIEHLIWSSVTGGINNTMQLLSLPNNISLSYQTPLPFKIGYKSPETLGVDRLALVAAAWQKFPNEGSLVIDAGTCITYDYINKQGEYLGGAIAPGLAMRFKSLYTFTKKLPDLPVPSRIVGLIGQTTQQSIEIGVLNGMVFEIEGNIKAYQQENSGVNIILTGGDANFLDKQLKNSIFVNQNFLLEGLNAVLMYQNT